MTTAESAATLKMLQKINARLDEQAVELTGLRKAFDIQFKRIAQLQAELDASPAGGRRRRQSAAAMSASAFPQPHYGNERTHEQ
jgi:hypothetical protein